MNRNLFSIKYNQLTGMVDLAILPYIPTVLMAHAELMDGIDTTQPDNLMLFHDNLAGKTTFYEGFGDLITSNFILLDHFNSIRFR